MERCLLYLKYSTNYRRIDNIIVRNQRSFTKPACNCLFSSLPRVEKIMRKKPIVLAYQGSHIFYYSKQTSTGLWTRTGDCSCLLDWNRCFWAINFYGYFLTGIFLLLLNMSQLPVLRLVTTCKMKETKRVAKIIINNGYDTHRILDTIYINPGFWIVKPCGTTI
jgi:hypothetical protein